MELRADTYSTVPCVVPVSKVETKAERGWGWQPSVILFVLGPSQHLRRTLLVWLRRNTSYVTKTDAGPNGRISRGAYGEDCVLLLRDGPSLRV